MAPPMPPSAWQHRPASGADAAALNWIDPLQLHENGVTASGSGSGGRTKKRVGGTDRGGGADAPEHPGGGCEGVRRKGSGRGTRGRDRREDRLVEADDLLLL